jgi:hypothetical protein
MLLRDQQSVRVMKSLILSGAPACAIAAAASTAGAVTFDIQPEISREINVTADSGPGWIPSADQRQSAMKGVQVFLDTVDDGRMDNATARSIEAQRSKAEVLRAWGELSRFCPNYVPTPDAR